MGDTDEKVKLRKFYTATRKKIPASEAEKLSVRIARNVFSLPGMQNAELVLLYSKLGSEADMAVLTELIIGSGRGAVLPYTREDGTIGIGRIFNPREDIEPGRFGMMIPIKRLRDNVYPEQLCAAVCPGVAFDEALTRLGRGGGHYDRFLPVIKNRAFIVGCCFDCQISETPLPKEPHDAQMNAVVTEKRSFPTGICPAIKLPEPCGEPTMYRGPAN